MNKRPQGQATSARDKLEKELIGDIENRKLTSDTGRSTGASPYALEARNRNSMFSIKQGVRRRHPNRVLHQFQQVALETSNAETSWEKALMHEQTRTTIPEEYKAKDSDMLVNQMGLVTTALDNFKKSKEKLVREYKA